MKNLFQLQWILLTVVQGFIILNPCKAYCFKPNSLLYDTTINLNVKSFDRLKIGDAFKVRIQQGDIFSVKVSGNKTDLSEILSEVKGSTLHVYYKPRNSKGNLTINRNYVEIDILMPSIVKIDVSQMVNFVLDNFKRVKMLEISMNELSAGSINLSVETIVLNLNNGSKLDFSGEVENAELFLNSQSVIKANNLAINNASIKLSGQSSAFIKVKSKLETDISGMSILHYSGRPILVRSSTADSSVIRDDI